MTQPESKSRGRRPAPIRSVMDLDRIPPQDLDAEKAMIGSLLIEPRRIDDMADLIRPGDCYSQANSVLMHTIFELHAENEPIDVATLRARLIAKSRWEEVGGAAYIAEVIRSSPIAAHCLYYAKIVKGHAARRRILSLSQGILSDAWEPDSDPVALADEAVGGFSSIAMDSSGGNDPVAIADAAVEAMMLVDQVATSGKGQGIPIGIPRFDRKIGGLFPGELVFLAARPGMGKTSLALQIAEYVSQTSGGVYYASLEMGRVELTLRMICAAAQVSFTRIRTGTLEPGDTDKLVRAAGQVSSGNIVLHDPPSLTCAGIRRAVAKIMRTVDLRLVVIDYLTLIKPPDTNVKRHEQVGAMTKALKALTREFRIPVLCLCQLNREKEAESRPALRHLRESGDIEQDADMVLSIFCDPGDKQEIPTNRVIEALKNRNGETGCVAVEWMPSLMRFVGAKADEQPPANREQAFDEFSGRDDFN